MKEKIVGAVISLLKVKSLITLLSFGAFFYLSVTEKINTDNFMLILGMIATYFFNKDGNTKGGERWRIAKKKELFTMKTEKYSM